MRISISILIFIGLLVSQNSYANQKKLNSYLESHCVINGNIKDNIGSCDPVEIKKQLGVINSFGFVTVYKYISGERIEYTITPDTQSGGYFYPGKIEENRSKFVLKGNILEVNIGGCIIVSKITDYNDNYIESISLGSKGKCSPGRQLAIDKLKGEKMVENTLIINN